MTHPLHVLSVMHLSNEQLSQLREVAPQVVITQHPLEVGQPFATVLSPEIEVLYTLRGDFALDHTPQLRWVQLESAGVNHLRGTALWASDLTLTSANGVHAIPIAEYVVSMLLAMWHQLPQAWRYQQQAHWAEPTRFLPRESRGATLGILGYGAVGREVGRLAQALGMRVLATKRHNRATAFDGWTPPMTGDPAGSIPEQYYDLTELASMLPRCDALLVALPLSAHTHHLLDATALAYLPEHALVINIGRGQIIDQDSLLQALQTGRLGGAILDVTDPEPLPTTSPLWSLDNVLLTPHIAGRSPWYNERAVALFAENLRRYINGEPLLNHVQRSLEY